MLKVLQSLRFKMLSLLIILLVIPISIAGYYLYLHITDDLTQMEKERVYSTSLASDKLIMNLGNQLLDTAKSNAYWEDYRLAVETKDVTWIDDNVNTIKSTVPNLHFIATTDLDGNVLSEVGNVKEFSGKLSNPEIKGKLKNINDFSGLITTSKGLAVIAVSKITNEEGNASPTGIIIFGRILDNKALNEIKATLHTDIAILTENGTLLTTSSKVDKSKLLHYVTEKNPNLLSFNTSHFKSIEYAEMVSALKDFTNKPIGVLLVNEKQTTSTSVKSSLINVYLLISMIFIFILGLLSLLIYKFIIKPIQQIVAISEDVSKGNLKNEVNQKILKRKDELGTLGFSMNILIMNFRNLMKEIKKNIDHSANNAQELEGSMNKANDSVNKLVVSIQQVAGNTSLSASNIEEIAAAVEQMSASINLVAENGESLATSAEETSSAIQEMMASIEQVAANVSNTEETVDQISTSIEEMSHSIKGVNNNANILASASEQTAETIEEMVVSIKQVADSAQTVNQLSQFVKGDALEGTASLNETLNGMNEISQAIEQASLVMESLGENSKEIGSIIEVIDNIADQTNLLALNAAIEAARAGDHGKGFAVVAEEVRKLAEQSANATKEIAVLIKGIQSETTIAVASIKEGTEKVNQGNRLAAKTNQAIIKITDGIARVTEEMNQIAKATVEQSAKSERIIQSVENAKKLAMEMTLSTKEETITAEEIFNRILTIKEQIQQISIATSEQAKGSQAIVAAVEDVTHKSSSVTIATKEQGLTAEDIVQNINIMKEMTREMTIATNDQARYGKEIALEVENVLKQTEELYNSIETQTKEVGDVAQVMINVSTQAEN
ncbi:methyl-accepting chemotaxis protein [Neobacillus sp. PS2-9]|uniref:methyl-accepting chemotaxis protein n=1 Tax=Neobacillus sp. PS2-9 TaxID=3070676 RepID=UPI0027DFCA8E|nr:methyl-accepting chemotaxis protein [Neobacillus sp. PS2-9]WML56474.1 methyl-accepting chemotaxis protein [Neobacillus sp. PS2-9]